MSTNQLTFEIIIQLFIKIRRISTVLNSLLAAYHVERKGDHRICDDTANNSVYLLSLNIFWENVPYGILQLFFSTAEAVKVRP